MDAGSTLSAAVRALCGRRVQLPAPLLQRYPELRAARFRQGGMPPRVAGWFMGRRGVVAITLWNIVFLARDVDLEAELLLHELRHVHQFQACPAFPFRYLWELLRHGYHRNRFEVEARAFARERLAATRTDPRFGDF